MLLDPCDVEDVFHARDMSLFKIVEPAENAENDFRGQDDGLDDSHISREEFFAVIGTTTIFHLLSDAV